jgi:hypothetical protein
MASSRNPSIRDVSSVGVVAVHVVSLLVLDVTTGGAGDGGASSLLLEDDLDDEALVGTPEKRQIDP